MVLRDSNSPLSPLMAREQRDIMRDEREIAHLSGEMVARLGVARERYVRQSSKMFASEAWLKRVAHDIVKQLWPTEEVLISA